MARTTRHTVLKARQLRKTMSKPEIMVWQQLRKKPLGIKFRRQHPIGSYIVDFYCPSAKLAIEVDGMAHDMATVRNAMSGGNGIYLALESRSSG